MIKSKKKGRKSNVQFKSGLERRFAELLLKHGVKAEYESKRFEFVVQVQGKSEEDIAQFFAVKAKELKLGMYLFYKARIAKEHKEDI